MCGCTLYDSPTCGHSWISMSQPCGFLSDLLNCPYRQTYQTLVAPPYTCPMCNGSFADRETIEMVQGPWGCNQMIRNHIGGSHSIPGQWGNAHLLPGDWRVPSLASSYGTIVPAMGRFGGEDHRFTGSYGSRQVGNGALVANPLLVPNIPMITNGAGPLDENYIPNYDYDWGCGGRRKSRERKTKYKYRYSNRPATNCTIM
ncbi:hypothetical protein BKA66DRAFT_405619 [Pyrenochaeta sp. MPI-SDFR-AT-0127]|nr:hypothetical protein BKA66DRAFT_405619 [Pyrenochaeta sp. MPI-SDFR-AT-0127]